MNDALPPVLKRTAPALVANIQLFTPAEVAHLFGVDPKTVTRWCKAGRLTAIRTLGGHRRYTMTEIKRVWEEGGGVWPF